MSFYTLQQIHSRRASQAALGFSMPRSYTEATDQQAADNANWQAAPQVLPSLLYPPHHKTSPATTRRAFRANLAPDYCRCARRSGLPRPAPSSDDQRGSCLHPPLHGDKGSQGPTSRKRIFVTFLDTFTDLVLFSLDMKDSQA